MPLSGGHTLSVSFISPVCFIAFLYLFITLDIKITLCCIPFKLFTFSAHIFHLLWLSFFLSIFREFKDSARAGTGTGAEAGARGPFPTSANVELIGFNDCQLPCKEKKTQAERKK